MGAVVGGSVVATVVVRATVVDVVDGGSVDSPVVVVASDDVVVASPPPAVTATRPKSNESGWSAGRRDDVSSCKAEDLVDDSQYVRVVFVVGTLVSQRGCVTFGKFELE